MNKLTAVDQLAFVRYLDLGDYEPRLRTALLKGASPAITDGNQAGYVDDGSLVSFVAGLSAQLKADVLNSVLLAQLAANKKFDRETATQQWYQFYHTVLENVGWVVQQFDFQKYQASGSTFSVDKVVIELLAAIASQNEVAVVNQTMNALKALSSDDGRLRLWDSSSHSGSSGNFQIGLCVESAGTVAMKMGAFYFSSSQSSTQFLWFSYSNSSMSLYKGGQAMTLNPDVYSKVRQSVIDKLGDRATQFVANLDI